VTVFVDAMVSRSPATIFSLQAAARPRRGHGDEIVHRLPRQRLAALRHEEPE